ncbi:MAG: CDC27 family protein [Tannerella sp.]|jgi:tetratricopeptide (TPR) repeat protein|nr:CDC27 family protein [Tannerella sp.]
MILFAGLASGVRAQSLDQAKKLYNDGSYEEARPAFERLVSQSPNNSSYNLWYGVCCYETGDWETAEKYLLTARNRKVSEASCYLANIYTAQYRFEEAVEMWESYIEQLQKKKENPEAFEPRLAMAEKLQRMKEKTEDVQVIDSLVVDRDQLLSAYFLSEDCGRMEPFDVHFESSEALAATVYVNPRGDQAYYARPSDSGRYALYTHSRLMDAWTDEKPVFPADTVENNYPFVLGDGLTLYFASKGNGSIGGYDLFVTRYNIHNASYLAPEQMGMPFNSPANDYLMVVDEIRGVGWFASDRNQPEGKVCLYLFIPDESRKRLENSEDDKRLRQRAMLSAIRETWADSRNYTALIQNARTPPVSGEKEKKKDFELVVNDRVTYYTWSDFRSGEAKSFYEKAVGLKKQASSVADKLEEARGLYAEGNSSVRDRLGASILQAEKEWESLIRQVSEWEKRARNTENAQLKKK